MSNQLGQSATEIDKPSGEINAECKIMDDNIEVLNDLLSDMDGRLTEILADGAPPPATNLAGETRDSQMGQCIQALNARINDLIGRARDIIDRIRL